jgi:hypothetical protein
MCIDTTFSQHTNTSDVLGRSLVTLNNDCYECSVKDVQIESLKQALNQSTRDNEELLLRVQELERERRKSGSSNISMNVLRVWLQKFLSLYIFFPILSL